MFININMNHWRAIKAWLDANGGSATLDMATHELEVRARNRYYRLYPQFRAEIKGRLSHVTALTPQATSFIGWRPYRPLSCELSTDKRVFKTVAAAASLPTPAWWSDAAQAEDDYVLKRSAGSFGYALAGPFRAGEVPPRAEIDRLRSGPQTGKLYAEAFIEGHNLKAWYWDGQPVHVHLHPYAEVRGDGETCVAALVDQRLQQVGQRWADHDEKADIVACLAYQGAALTDVPALGERVWLDYRYGRAFLPPAVTESEDNALSRLAADAQQQVIDAGKCMADALRGLTRAPLLFSIDGVLDKDGTVWWLELNSNPICPPNAYFPMFSTLFNTPPGPTPAAYANAVRASQAVTAQAPAGLRTQTREMA